MFEQGQGLKRIVDDCVETISSTLALYRVNSQKQRVHKAHFRVAGILLEDLSSFEQLEIQDIKVGISSYPKELIQYSILFLFLNTILHYLSSKKSLVLHPLLEEIKNNFVENLPSDFSQSFNKLVSYRRDSDIGEQKMLGYLNRHSTRWGSVFYLNEKKDYMTCEAILGLSVIPTQDFNDETFVLDPLFNNVKMIFQEYIDNSRTLIGREYHVCTSQTFIKELEFLKRMEFPYEIIKYDGNQIRYEAPEYYSQEELREIVFVKLMQVAWRYLHKQNSHRLWPRINDLALYDGLNDIIDQEAVFNIGQQKLMQYLNKHSWRISNIFHPEIPPEIKFEEWLDTNEMCLGTKPTETYFKH